MSTDEHAEVPFGAYSIENFARSHAIGRSTAYTEIAARSTGHSQVPRAHAGHTSRTPRRGAPACRSSPPAQPRAARPSKPSATLRNWKGPRHEQPYLKRWLVVTTLPRPTRSI